jgi:D-tyrosyl-tRNA(Tyr) deacylase
MRVVIQRVSKASVVIDNQTYSSIKTGLLVLLGIESIDTQEDIAWICGKISKLRIFEDEQGIMNRSIIDVDGNVLLVSQFTLHASTKKGNRPSYIRAAPPDIANNLYQDFINILETTLGKPVFTGKFGAMMEIELINNGPVTIIIDSKNKE